MIKFVVCKTKEQLMHSYIMRKDVFVTEQGAPMEDEFDFTELHKTVVLIYEDDVPIATGRIAFLKDVCKLERICVIDSFRGKHIGQYLMNEMMDYGREEGFRVFVLGSQEQAIGFYQRFGFQVYGEPFLDGGIRHRMMRKEE